MIYNNLKNPSIEKAVNECFENFMAKEIGPIECGHCAYFNLCTLWKNREPITLLFMNGDVVDSETGEVLCETREEE